MSDIIIKNGKPEIIKNACVYISGKFADADIYISGGKISDICIHSYFGDALSANDGNHLYVFPGFTDVHVHLREPGFLYKETVKTGTYAAARGGYTTVCAMPNLNPVPDCMQNLNKELDAIKKDARINVLAYGAITKGENGLCLSDMDNLSDGVVAFSDDGKGVQSADIMKEAMIKARRLGKIIAAHCEDNSLLNGGYINDGEYAKLNGHKGICAESEYKPIERDIKLAAETKVKYHVCHISTAQSVELIRNAKKAGVDITCETAPHYAILNDTMLKDDGRFKMNPPIRSESDRLAIVEGIKNGTIDMIATDHAPHSAKEKSGGLKDSLNGVVGLETAFAEMYTNLVKTKIITLNKLIELLSVNPNKRFGINCEIRIGNDADFTVFDLKNPYYIDSSLFLSKGKSTPFDSDKVYGKCLATIFKGEFVWQECTTEK